MSESSATSLASLGLSFDASTGVLSGTPSPNTGGTYGLIFTASNRIGSDANQSFSLTISQASAITSADNATFVTGSSGTFTVTATGTPTPTLSESGALPGGVTFDASTDELSGTPAVSAGGDYPLTFTSSNGIGPAATQDFDLWVVSPGYLLNAPTNFVVTGLTTTSIALSWTDNAPGATSYEVQEAVVGSTNFAPVTGSPFGPGTTNVTATGLTSGLTYQFEVRAVAAGGPSAWVLNADVETLLSTATSLSADPNPLVLTQTSTNTVDQSNDVTFTATVTNTSGTSDVPVGQVDFQDMTTATDLGTVPLTDGSASLYVPSFSVGSDTIIATYTPYPASIFAGSANQMTEAVEAATATTVTAAPDPGINGQPVSFTATVENQFNEGGTPTGSVQFQVDGVNYGQPVDLDQNGEATISDPSLAVGNHDISVSYAPTGSFTPSQGDTTEDVDDGDSWTGEAGDNNWDTPGNWTLGVPQSGVDAYLTNLPAGTVIALGPADVANNVAISSDATFSGGSLTVAGMFTDSGSLMLDGSAMVSVSTPGAFVLQKVTIQPGGTLSGQGTVQGDLVNDGELDMGSTDGVIVVTGNYTQGAIATLSMKIDGAVASDFDQLQVLGTATLNGTLSAELTNGFTPAPGSSLDLLKLAKPASGSFSTVLSPSNDLQTQDSPGGVIVEDEPIGQSVSVTYPGVPQWVAEGPEPIYSAQSNANPDNGEEGAIANVVVAPDGTVYVGTVNGGVWSSDQVTPSWVQTLQDHDPFQPSNFWVPLTDSQPSLAVSTMALDPNDRNNTLWVGTGSVSSYNSAGGPAVGLLKTTNGGKTWVDLAGSPGAPITGVSASGTGTYVITTSNTGSLIAGSEVSMSGFPTNDGANGTWTFTNVTATSFTLTSPVSTGQFVNSPNAQWTSSIYGDTIVSVVPTATTDPTTGEQVILVGTNGQGLWRSTDGGANFAPASFFASERRNQSAINLFTQQQGFVTSVVADPTNPDYFYAAVRNVGIFESYDDGASWNEIDASIPQITNATWYELAAAQDPDGNTILYVATAIPSSKNGGAQFAGLLFAQISPIPLAPITWIPVYDHPQGAQVVGEAVQVPGHFYLAVNPTNPSDVYIGGMLQCLYSGVVATTSVSPSGWAVYWNPLSGGNGKPHDDQRDIAFLSDGTILEVTDGGIYGLLPDGNHWVDLNENIQDTEFFSIAYDAQDNEIFGGTQDNGTPAQTASGNWSLMGGVHYGGGDGGAVAVDNSGSESKEYLFSDGNFETHSDTYNADIALSGLNSVDQQTVASGSGKNPADASFFVAVNPFGPAPGSTTGLAPILLGGGIEGNNNQGLTGLYESFNGGATVTQVASPIYSGNPSAFTYASAGGMAYFGTTNGYLFVRSAYGATFIYMPAPNWSNAYATQIVTDPKNPNIVYVLDNLGDIWGSANQGVTGWTKLTGGTNLQALDTYQSVLNIGELQGEAANTTVQTIQVVDPTPYTPGSNVLLAGALGGVYSLNVDLGALQPSQYTWSLYGQGLPNVQVSDLDYVASANLLLAGTFGRGVWEITDASASIGAPDQATISASGGTILLRSDPARPGYAQLLSDGPGVTVSQVIADDNVQLEEQWAALGQITINVQSETVDILNVPQGVRVTVDGGTGPNIVNVGSAANQLTTIAGAVEVGVNVTGSLTSLNINDQGDTAASNWTIGTNFLTEPTSLPGSILYQGIAGVVINAANANLNSFIVNDTAGTSALTINTGTGAGNQVTVNDTSNATTLNINNQGTGAVTVVKATGPQSNTDITDSGSDTITLGNSTGVQAIQGDIGITSKVPDADGLIVDDQGDAVLHQGNQAVTVTNSSIVGLARGTISYAPYSLGSLSLEANGMGTFWNIQGTPIPYLDFENQGTNNFPIFVPVALPITTSISCADQDIVDVGDPSNGLQDIFGTLNIYSPGPTAAVQVNLDDHETTYPSPPSLRLTNNSVSGLGPGVINYGIPGYDDGLVIAGGVSELTVRAGTGGTKFMVGDMTGGPTMVNLSALGTGNSIVGPDSSVNWTFQGHINNPLDSFTQGSDASTVDFAGIDTITGGSGSNDFQFIQTGFDGSIDGGPSGDSTLDFSQFGGSSLSVETTQDGSLNGVRGNATEGTSFNDIDTVLGDPSATGWEFGNTTGENYAYQGDFTATLTVSGFANIDLNFSQDFSGKLLASTEGTATDPISEINVTGTITVGAMIKVAFLNKLVVNGDVYGIIKGFGDDPSVPTIQTMILDGTVRAGAQIVASSFGTIDTQQNLAGTLSETAPTGDFQSVTIGGSILPTGLIDAPGGGTLSVTGDLSGEAVIGGTLGTLSVGGALDGTVSAGSYGSENLGGPVTGQIDTGLTTAPPVSIAAGDVAGLIQALDDANSIAQPNVINLAPGATYVLTAPDNDTNGPNGLPVLLSNITINGNGAVIEGAGSTPFRLFSISSGANVVLDNLTIEQGSSEQGGGVYNAGTLALTNDVLTGNSATGNGGAVFNDGTLTQSSTSFSNNSAGGSGPNVFDAVIPTATTTTLTDNGPTTSTFGQSVNFTVNVTGEVPDGEAVTLEDADNDNAVVATGTLAGGTANVAVTTLSGGAHDIFAVYGGDSTLTGSQSSTVTQTVNQAPTFTSAPDVTFTVGASDSFTVTASGYSTPTLSENTNDVLPSGITFDPSTGILSGTPALGTVGIYTLNFTADNGIGNDATQKFTLTIGAATPVITWNTPNPITYGTPLDSTELDATANVSGTYAYTQAAGTVLPAVNTPLLAVTFTPTDTADYATVTQTVPIEVDPAPLTVYADSQTMPYDSVVPALTFTAYGFVNGDTAASLPGSLATVATSTIAVGSYDITLGTLGSFADSESSNLSNYNITYFDADLTVTQATPTITWTPPSAIDDQTPLSSALLDATANVLGTFVYSPAAGTILSAGTQTLSVTFMPDDTVDYSTEYTSVSLTVASAAAPAVTTQPSSQTVSAGGMAEFTAAASGGPSPFLQWQVNSGSGWNDVNLGGVYSLDANGDLIVIGAPTTLNGNQYQAVFSNNSGSVTTDIVTLNVTPITTTTGLIDYGPIPATTAQPISLTVTVSGGAPDGELVTIEDASNGNAVVPTTGNTLAGGSATLTIAAGALSAGTHDLFAVYGGEGTFAGSHSPMVSQTVNAVAITITTQPTDQSVAVGSTATFTAAASGNPTPTVQWQQSTSGSSWSNINGATSTTFTLAHVSFSQDGDAYRAIFTNSVGSATSNPATLTVEAAPVIVAPVLATIPSQLVNVGRTLELNVSRYASDPNTPPLPLTYRLVGSPPAGASLDPATGIMTWAVGANQPIGTYAVTVLVSDNGSPARTASETINVNIVDSIPVKISSATVNTKKGFAITLTLSGPVNPVTATNPNNYILTEPAKKPRSKKKPAPPPIRIKLRATYNPATNQVILKGPKTVKTSPALSFTVVGTGIAKLDGLDLAGNGGLPGTNYAASVTKKSVSPASAVAGNVIAVPTSRHPAGPIALARIPAKASRQFKDSPLFIAP